MEYYVDVFSYDALQLRRRFLRQYLNKVVEKFKCLFMWLGRLYVE